MIERMHTRKPRKCRVYKNQTSLRFLAAVLAIPAPKKYIDGSDMVRVYWQDKGLPPIKIYCQKDVATTAQLLLCFRGQAIVQEEHIALVD